MSGRPTILRVRVADRRDMTSGIFAFDLEPESGSHLPAWSPGDHADVHTRRGTRPYSLCGDPDAPAWRLGVRRGAEGGVSAWLHDRVRRGDELVVGVPRSTFPFETATSYLFIAGGVGITALLPMIHQAERERIPWRLLHSAREGAHAFSPTLPEDRITLWCSDEGRVDVAAHLVRLPAGAAVYCCGPDGLTASVATAAGRHGIRFRAERFAASSAVGDREFEIGLVRSERTLTVPAGRTALDVLNEAGLFVPSSCRSGVCGTCEIDVVDGEVDHRDEVLSDAERAANTSMLPCVSRARTSRVLVDL